MASLQPGGGAGDHVVTELHTWQTPDTGRWTLLLRQIGQPRASVLLGLLVLHAIFAVWVAQPGHFSIDEGIYHQMSRALAEGMWPQVWNGYGEFPSEELRHPLHQVRDGELLSQYPYLHAVLAWPFYALAGYRGLFALNALALLAVAGFCYATARRLYGEPRVAADAAILLILGTFIWQYGHAAWPHAVSAAFVGGAVLLAVMAAGEPHRKRATMLAGTAGLVIGFGAGIRLDAAFAAPALVVPFLFAAPPRLREASAAAAGMLPGFALLAVTNHAKFGSYNPFSYGPAGGGALATAYLPLALLGLASLLALWLLSRPRVWSATTARPLPFLAGLALLAALALALPPVSSLLARLANGAWQLLVDFRIRDPNHLEPGLERGPLGSIVYLGMVKKSLLQSLPWLPVAVLAAAASLRAWRTSTPHQILILAVSGYAGAYSLFAWHGGMSFNLRYFVPVLPFLAVYGARGLHDMTTGLPDGTRRALLFAGAMSVFLWLFLLYRAPVLEAQEPVLLNVPLILASLLTACLLWLALARPAGKAAKTATAAVLAFCVTWSSVVAIGYDFPFAALRRAGFAMVTNEISPFIRPDSIVFTGVDTAYFGLLEKPGVRIAAVKRDDFANFAALAQYHLAAGRPAYVAFDDETWSEAEERGAFDGFEVTILTKYLIGTLAALRPRPDTP